MGRNKHNNFRVGTDMNFFTLEWEGLNVDDCKVLAKSGMLDSPGDEQQADAVSRLFRVADVPMDKAIYSKTSTQKIVEPAKRKFYSGTIVSHDQGDAKRYMQERDQKYNLDSKSGALWGNHLSDLEFGLEKGFKLGKLKTDEDKDSKLSDDEEVEQAEDTDQADKIHRLKNDLKSARKTSSDQAKTITGYQKQVQDLQDKLSEQQRANDRLQAELDQAEKDQKAFDELKTEALKAIEQEPNSPLAKKLAPHLDNVAAV